MEEIIDTSGFYKEVNGEWFYAKNEVVSLNYTISRKRYEEIGVAENKDGWIWHNEAPLEYLEWKESENKKKLELKGE